MVIGSGEIGGSRQAMRVFICYAREDKELLRHFEQHLAPLRKQGIIEPWDDGEIKAGSKWEEEIKRHLDAADIILLLISPGFMASDYCYSTEMTRAMERHERQVAYVIPIIARPVYWQEAPFSKLQVLPPYARPIVVWPNEDEAFFYVVRELRKLIEEVRKSREERARLQAEAEARRKAQEERWQQDEAEAQCKADEERKRQVAEEIHSQNARVLAQQAYSQGDNYLHEGHYTEAVAAFERAIALDPIDVCFHSSRGRALDSLGRHEEALDAYKQAIALAPDNASHFSSKADMLAKLGRYEEVLDVYEQAIVLAPTDASHLVHKGHILARLERYDEALAVYNKAIRLQPSIPIMRLRWRYYTLWERGTDMLIRQLTMMAAMHWHEDAWRGKSSVLHLLRRPAEAQRASEQAKESGKLWWEVMDRG